jgi:DNA repair protein RadD
VRYVEPAILMTTRGIGRTAGDFNQRELVAANVGQVRSQVSVILDSLTGRAKAMIFAVNVDHAEEFVAALRARGEDPALIIGAMGAAERRADVGAFRIGTKRLAVTVQAALTGFDVPDLDLIASCRPTLSPIIHTQSIGRGTRPAEGKADLLVLDFAGNVPTFGPVHRPHFDSSGQPRGGIAPWRPCRACATYNHFNATACSHCGAEIEVRRQMTAERLEFGTINWHREQEAIQALVAARGSNGLPVETVAFHAYRKRSDPSSISGMLSFSLGGDAIVRLWIKRFRKQRWQSLWCDLLGDLPAPRSLDEAYQRRGELVRPAAIAIEREGNFWRVPDISYGDDELNGVST